MDPRQPQLPFSRNTASPYGRSPFPPSTNQPPQYPPTSHAPAAAPAYSDHQRRPSDPPYYNPQRNYGPESGSAHSRHQSSSSVGHGTPVNRGMPPPSSPQQQTPQHSYGPPPPRAPTMSVGPPTGFASGRELPALNSLGRPSTNSNGMSISSILGGPTPAARDQTSSQYGSPVPAPAAPNSVFPGQPNASPRANTMGPDYAPFRRPQTPEHQRSYEQRDHGASTAGSPAGPTHYSTPDGRRYGATPTYAPRQLPPAEERREPVRVQNPNAIPARPESQPTTFNPSRPADSRTPIHTDGVFGRRENPNRVDPAREPTYQRNEYEEMNNSAYAYAERARQERDVAIQREREQRERAHNEHASNLQQQQEFAHQVAQRNAQTYNRPPEQREPPAWMRSGYETPRAPPYEPIPEQQPHQREPVNNHEYGRSAVPPYGGYTAYASNEHRYPPASHAQPMQAQHSSIPASQYDVNNQERQRLAQEQQRQQPVYGQPSQSAPYQPQESPTRRQFDESQQIQQQAPQQRSLLGVQEINRKGRVSPLPQAVQGAQAQIGVAGGEPGIKSEFGRMFSGIGSGVGGIGVPSPVTSHQGLPGAGQLRREDVDGLQGHDSPVENGGFKTARTASGTRRRKLKEEDSKGDDDSSTGRHTPSGRGKRPKTHHHHHHNHHHHHHHHRPDTLDNISPPSQPNPTPFKPVKGGTVSSPPDLKAAPILHHHHVPRHHHHHVPPAPKPAIIPLPKTTVRSKAVLDAVAHLPRKHLGYDYYQAELKPTGSIIPRRNSGRGFASTPRPLPRFEGSENCTFTIKVPRVYLTSSSRAEITSRKAVWGTDVYTDDSDVIAACIHQGWFRGEWDEDVDISLLGLELEDTPPSSPKDFLTEPPRSGPMPVPPNRDCHITVLILPLLEKYGSTTRFGIRSREWGGDHEGYKGVHDGLSFMIMSVRWVEGVDGKEGLRGMKRRALLESEMEAEREDVEFFNSLETSERWKDKDITIMESFERGNAGSLPGDIKGIGMGSWWKPTSPKADDASADADKQQQGDQKADAQTEATSPEATNGEATNNGEPVPGEAATDEEAPAAAVEADSSNKEVKKITEEEQAAIEHVTKRMIENANAHTAGDEESVDK